MMFSLAKFLFLLFILQTVVFSNPVLELKLREEKKNRNDLLAELASSHATTANIPIDENFNMTLYKKEVDKRREKFHPEIAKSYDVTGQILQKLNRHEDALKKFKKGLILSYSISGENSNISQDILDHAMESLLLCNNDNSKIDYIKLIIGGVKDSHQPIQTLEKAETLLSSVKKSSKKEELLAQIEKFKSTDFLLYAFALVIVLIFLVLALLYYFKIYYSPLIQKISKSPRELLILSPTELKKVKFDLQILLQWSDTLRLAKTTNSKVKRTLSFYQKPSIEVFMDLVELKDYEQKEALYFLKNIEIGLNLKTLSLLLTKDNLSTIKENYLTGERIFIVSHHAYQDEIARFCQNRNNNLIAPTSAQLTELLLSQNPKKVLANILASCLTCRYLSPYQTKGAINLKNNFFGRTEIIRDITSKESNNYFLVGARQLGKSSILKALERDYQENSNIECHYFSLEYGDIVEELSMALNINKKSSLEEIVSVIKAKKRKVIFLIDEADFLSENEHCMKISSTFRKLSQENHAMFIFAGFWKLYQSVTMDYHSPLKNFAELIHLGQLEDEACEELMLKPMQRLNISYENQDIVKNVIRRCGNRANLIAMVCDNILKELKVTVITKKDVEQAFMKENIYTSINGWQGLSSDKKENRINRLIVYLTFKLTDFSLSDVLGYVKEKEIELSIEEIEVSLKQLNLSYVLKKENNLYGYQVPMLKEFLLEEELELEMILSSLIQELKRVKKEER